MSDIWTGRIKALCNIMTDLDIKVELCFSGIILKYKGYTKSTSIASIESLPTAIKFVEEFQEHVYNCEATRFKERVQQLANDFRGIFNIGTIGNIDVPPKPRKYFSDFLTPAVEAFRKGQPVSSSCNAKEQFDKCRSDGVESVCPDNVSHEELEKKLKKEPLVVDEIADSVWRPGCKPPKASTQGNLWTPFDTNNPCHTAMTSNRIIEWDWFEGLVRKHIREYTVPQYGDYPNDQMTTASKEDIIHNMKRYINRALTNARPEEAERDIIKIAHYCAILLSKMRGV